MLENRLCKHCSHCTALAGAITPEHGVCKTSLCIQVEAQLPLRTEEHGNTSCCSCKWPDSSRDTELSHLLLHTLLRCRPTREHIGATRFGGQELACIQPISLAIR